MIILMRAEGEKNETKAVISGTYIIVTFVNLGEVFCIWVVQCY
jgi:hypothetical protein